MSKGRNMGKRECRYNCGQCRFWELRLLAEKGEARKIDWGHSMKSLKGLSDEFIYNSLNNKNPTFSLWHIHELFIC